MNHKIKIVSVAALLLLLAAGGGLSVQAFFGKNEDARQNQEKIREAITNNDYSSWKNLIEERARLMTEQATKEHFQELVSKHQEGNNGDGEQATKRQQSKKLQDAASEALANNDYNAWKEAMSERHTAEELSEEEFAKLAEAHRLMNEGKYEEARAIQEELGLSGYGFRGAKHNSDF